MNYCRVWETFYCPHATSLSLFLTCFVYYALFHWWQVRKAENGEKKTCCRLCAGLGKVPSWIKMFFFFPLSDTRFYIFIAAIGKIAVVNVSAFMLFMPRWRLPPQIGTVRAVMRGGCRYFYSFVLLPRTDTHKPSCGLMCTWLALYVIGKKLSHVVTVPSVGTLQRNCNSYWYYHNKKHTKSSV